MTARRGRRPVIYAYTIGDRAVREWTHRSGGSGWIKVGYTERDARTRIQEQENSPEEPVVLFEQPALTDDGSIFRDHDVHAALEELGAHRILKASTQTPTEWFEATLEEVRRACLSVQTKRRSIASWNFTLRAEQRRAVLETASYFRSHSDSRARHFLWNAKMRFGKTFTAYQLAREMNWRRVLVLTFKPAAEGAWREIIERHVDFEDWQFVGTGDSWLTVDETKPLAQMVSFQKLMGTDQKGQIKESLELVHAEDWDCIMVDEYHFGAWRDGAKAFYDANDAASLEDFRKEDFPLLDDRALRAAHWLYLSGTPFRALAQGEFAEDQIFNWTYADEQTEKAKHAADAASPYADMPSLTMYAYRMGDAVRRHAEQTFEDEFDLNVFFSAKHTPEGWKFDRETEVQYWLDWMHQEPVPGEPLPCAPYAIAELQAPLSHSVWFLHSVAACRAMKALLGRDPFYRRYDVILAAGTAAGSGVKALKAVRRRIADGGKTRTITLTCGKLMTGVTVPQWGAIFMLRNLNAAETYYQAAFRVQSPWSQADPRYPGRRVAFKKQGYIFDFAPQRALDLIASYCSSVAANERRQPDEVRDFLHFLPVLCYEDGKMVELDENELLDYAYSGIGAAMLAKRWQSARLVNLDRETLTRLLDNASLCDALQNIEAFRNLRNDARKIVNSDEHVKKLRREKRRATRKARKERDEARRKRKELQKKLIQFLCKVPLFMYLTDFREESLADVIRRVETPLFVKVTGLQLDQFDELCRIGVFNERALNSSIFAFRRQEAKHLDET